MDWHMYLILFIAMILFIGIVLFAERKSKDPVSLWNRKNASIYFKGSDFKNDAFKSNLPRDHGDLLFDPMYSSLPGNIYHNPFYKD